MNPHTLVISYCPRSFLGSFVLLAPEKFVLHVQKQGMDEGPPLLLHPHYGILLLL